MVWPSACNAFAVAKPKPDEAPVTRITFFILIGVDYNFINILIYPKDKNLNRNIVQILKFVNIIDLQRYEATLCYC
jgi:hypothetical protein